MDTEIFEVIKKRTANEECIVRGIPLPTTYVAVLSMSEADDSPLETKTCMPCSKLIIFPKSD